jgi:cell division protein FtsQ
MRPRRSAGSRAGTRPRQAPRPGPDDGDTDPAARGAAGGNAPGEGKASEAGDPGATPHPRMRHRRITVQRDQGRRRLARLTWAAGATATVIGVAALAQTPLFDVDQIEVEGVGQTTPEAVLWASGIRRGDALLTLDEAGAEDRIEQLPWVADADVVRDWPGSIRITVTEREPAAVVQPQPGGSAAVVDATGRVLSMAGLPLPGLITVTGAPGRLAEGERVPTTVRDALAVAVGAAQRVPGAVASVSQDLEATLAQGGVVRFGSTAELEEKLVTLATFLSDVDLTNLAVLDLQVPGRPVLTRHG